MKSRWLSAAVFAVAMAMSACGGMEEDVAQEPLPAASIQESQPGETQQQAISCDAQGRCPPSLVCDIGWKCRYYGGHR